MVPANWATAFAQVGAADAAGVVTGFPLDVTGATPGTVDPPQSAPYNSLNVMNFGSGLPLGPVPIVSGMPVSLSAPVTTIPESVTVSNGAGGTEQINYDEPTGTVQGFTIGPFTVTGAAGGTSSTSVDTAPAWGGNDITGYTTTGGAYSQSRPAMSTAA